MSPQPGTVTDLLVDGLRIETGSGVEIVNEVSFRVGPGDVFGLVGESGCGKTSVAMALLGHARPGTRIATGSVRVGETDVLSLSAGELRKVRGRLVSYVPQDPSASLSPRMKIGDQMVEAMTIHGIDKARTDDRVRSLFGRVELPGSDDFLGRYPFELSGGQQQRVLIAMALACTPSVVVLDEPTTGLDVTTQGRVLHLLSELARDEQVAFIYISHDLAVVRDIATSIGVMYSGRLVECGSADAVFMAPQHPYTVMLLDSVPRIAVRHRLTGIQGTAAAPGERPTGCHFRTRCPAATEECAVIEPPPVPAGLSVVRCLHPGSIRPQVVLLGDPVESPAADAVLTVGNLTASYGSGRRRHEVVHGVDFEVARGECVALVGESGSGKSTIGRAIAGLHPWDDGQILLDGTPLPKTVRKRSLVELRTVQLIFQNPDRSLNPSYSVRKLIERPMNRFGIHGSRSVEDLLDAVRLARRVLTKRPQELSGGEKQRVAIARALAAEPDILVCDEITSALDVSIQAAILDVLTGLRDSGLSMLFITHNLGVVRSLADRTLVIEQGQIVERGGTAEVLGDPEHPYTRALMNAAYDIPEAGHGSELRA